MSEDAKTKTSVSRRDLLGGTATVAAMAGLAGAGVVGGVALSGGGVAQAATSTNKTEVKPGDLDDYYCFHSGGQSGEVRIVGL
ncbi:MAG: TAT-dependent nitrous-oxide reductase, partial [Rhodospirillaceae bacterium]